jgi:hypothetical protein
LSFAEMQRLMRQNAAIVSHDLPGEEYSTGHVPGPVISPVNVAPAPSRSPARNLPLPDSASQ